MRIGKTGRALALTSVAALALSLAASRPTAAEPIGESAKAGIAAAGADELSARRRDSRHRYSGNAAAVRTFGAIAGTIGGIVAAEQARRYYRRHYWADPYAYPYYGSPYYGSYSYYDPYW